MGLDWISCFDQLKLWVTLLWPLYLAFGVTCIPKTWRSRVPKFGEHALICQHCQHRFRRSYPPTAKKVKCPVCHRFITAIHTIAFFSGFETGDLGEWTSVVGAPTVVDTIKNTGDYAMRCYTEAAQAYVVAPSGRDRTNFNIYIASSPDMDCIILGGTTTASLRLTSDNYIKLYYGSTYYATSSSPLSTGAWHRICLSVNPDAGAYTNLYFDRVIVIHYDRTGGFCPWNQLGVITECTADLYFDDFTSDTESSNVDLSDIRVLRASPNAAGQYAEFNTISGYGNCDEVPANDADFVDDSGVSVIHRETYNLQNYATIGVGASDLWKAVNVLVRGYDSGASLQGITVRDDGTDYETLALFGKAFTWKNKLYVTNAPRAAPWSGAIFDAFQAGGYSEGSKDVYISNVMVMVAFIPAATFPQAPTNFASPSQTETTIDLTWTKGANSDKTLIRFKEGSYPSSISDGYQAYFDTGESVTVQGDYSILQELSSGTVGIYTGGLLRAAERVNNFPVVNISRVSFLLLKYGSPTGTAYIRIRRVSDDAIVGTVGSKDVSTLTLDADGVWYNFDCDIDNPTQQDLRFTIEYSGGNVTNWVGVRRQGTDVLANAVYSSYSSSWTDYGTRDTAIKIYYTSPLAPTTTYYFRAWGYQISTELYSVATADLTQATSGAVAIPRYPAVNFQNPAIV